VNKVVFDELDGRGLKPLAPPKVEDVKLDEGQPMSFKAVFETLPLIELPDWRGLRVSEFLYEFQIIVSDVGLMISSSSSFAVGSTMTPFPVSSFLSR